MVRTLACAVVLIAACEQPPGELDREPPVALKPAVALAPAPPPTITGTALTFADRIGDSGLRHGNIMAVGISARGRFAASGSATGPVAVWDASDGHLVRWIETPHKNVYAVAVTDDGALVATSGWDETVRVFDVATGKQRWEAKGSADRLGFDPNGTRLVARRFELYRVWSASDGRALWVDVDRDPYDHDHMKPERAHAMASDGSIAIELQVTGRREVQMGCVSDSMPTSYDAVAHDVGAKTARRAHVGGGSLEVLGTSPKADRVAVIGGREVRGTYASVLDVFAIDGTLLASLQLSTGTVPPRTNVLLTDSPRYAITWDLNEVAAWDLLAHREIWRGRGGLFRDPQLAGTDTVITAEAGACIARRISDGVRLWARERCLHVAAAPGSPTVLLARGPGALELLNAATGTTMLPATSSVGPLADIAALAVSPDGAHTIAYSTDAAMWRVEAAALRPLVPTPHPLWRPILRFLGDGKLAVVDETAGGARSYRYDVVRDAIESTRDIKLQHRLGGTGVFAGDKLIVAQVREHDYIYTEIDLHDRAPPRTLPAWKRPTDRPKLELRNESLYYAVIDPIAQRAYVTGEDNHIHAWNLRSGRLVARSEERHGFIRDLVLSPDRKRVIVPRDEGPIVVLAAATLKEERKLVGPKRYVTMAAVSPDGTLVAAAALDGLYLWRLSDGTRVATVDFAPSHETPTSIAFSPDGATLSVGTDIGTLLRFRAVP